MLSLYPEYSMPMSSPVAPGMTVFEVADGVMTPEEGRELVSRAAESMSLSPDYSIGRAFDFELTKKGCIRPGIAGLLTGIEYSRVGSTAWVHPTSTVTTHKTVGLA